MNSAHDPLVWNDTFVAGVQEIDEQHMILVDLLNRVKLKLLPEPENKEMEQIILDLLSYALYHFETEERLMDEFGYGKGRPQDANAHLEQHRFFSEKVVSARKAHISGETLSAEELLTFLSEWLVNHILKTDFKLANFIQEKRRGVDDEKR
jgi:hemerythrin-like metal-binding protein